MAQLIEDLLTLSRVSRGELQREAVDVGSIARQVVVDLQHRDAGRAVEVTIWDGMQAHADPRLLRAALENLVGNAWKVTAKAAAPRIESGALADSARATYFVRDNRARRDIAHADTVFGPFPRAHSAHEHRGPGR